MKGLPLKEAMQLLFRETFKERVVIPSMEPVAAVVCTLERTMILTEVKQRKPGTAFPAGFASINDEHRSVRDILWHFVSSFEGK